MLDSVKPRIDRLPKTAELALAFLSAFGLVISWYNSRIIDEKPLSILGFISSLSPFYWVFMPICLIALFYAAAHGREKLTAFLILLLGIYAELPRLIFTQPYQLESFHQAQVYHVVSNGSTLDSSYPMPQSGVMHSILWAESQLVTGVDARLIVLYIAPVLLVSFSALILYALLRKQLGILLSSALSVFFLAFGVEVIYTNHYGQIFPYYAIFWPLLSRSATSRVGGRRYIVLLFIVSAALAFTHIGASFSLSLDLLLVSLVLYFLAYIRHTQFSFRGSIGYLAMACYLLLWDVFNPSMGTQVTDRLVMMVESFTNLINLDFLGLQAPSTRFNASMVPLYRVLLNLKFILVFTFSFIIPAAFTLMLLHKTSTRVMGTRSRIKNIPSEIKERMANSPFFTVIFCSWLLHVGLIGIGLAGGWGIERWAQLSIIIVLVYISTILTSLRKKDQKKLGKLMIMAAILFMLLGIQVKWDVTFTYIQIPNKSISLGRFTYLHSGPELIYTSAIGGDPLLFRQLYGPKTRVWEEGVALDDLFEAPIVNQSFLLVDSGVTGSMQAKYRFDKPLLEVFREFYNNQTQRMNVVYVNDDENNIRALLVKPGKT